MAFVLKSYLSDEVNEEVENLDKIDEVWQRLDKKYGNEGKHIDILKSEIKEAPVCEEGDDNTLIWFVNIIEIAHRDLVKLGLEKEISNSTIVSIIEAKIPIDVKKEWLKIVSGENRIEITRNKFEFLSYF